MHSVSLNNSSWFVVSFAGSDSTSTAFWRGRIRCLVVCLGDDFLDDARRDAFDSRPILVFKKSDDREEC